MSKRELRLRNIPETKMQQMENIAAYYGYDSVAKWAKSEFLKLISNFPEHIKNTPWENGEKVTSYHLDH